MKLFRQNSALPNFLDSQRDSFRFFLEKGIREELDFFSPIVGQSLGSASKRPTDRFISVSFHSKDFYFKVLPNLGWERIGDDLFLRGKETLEIDYKQEKLKIELNLQRKLGKHVTISNLCY